MKLNKKDPIPADIDMMPQFWPKLASPNCSEVTDGAILYSIYRGIFVNYVNRPDLQTYAIRKPLYCCYSRYTLCMLDPL